MTVMAIAAVLTATFIAPTSASATSQGGATSWSTSNFQTVRNGYREYVWVKPSSGYRDFNHEFNPWGNEYYTGYLYVTGAGWVEAASGPHWEPVAGHLSPWVVLITSVKTGTSMVVGQYSDWGYWTNIVY
jgi:hypothetical protein